MFLLLHFYDLGILCGLPGPVSENLGKRRLGILKRARAQQLIAVAVVCRENKIQQRVPFPDVIVHTIQPITTQGNDPPVTYSSGAPWVHMKLR